MSAAQYFELEGGQLANQYDSQFGATQLTLNKPDFAPVFREGRVPGATNRHGGVMPVNVVLQEVMFTSRVPLSTWTFVFAINDKLWVSDLTTLYFGKRKLLQKNIFRNKMFVPDQGASLELGITAYNSYGDLFSSSRQLRVYPNNKAGHVGEMCKIDEDWTQLLFKFQVRTER